MTDDGSQRLLARRQVLKGGLALGLFSITGGGLQGCASWGAGEGFRSVPLQSDPGFDRVIVPDGYRAEAFFSWGDAVLADAPPWRADASDDWQAQLRQAGDNHDGMAYFPFRESPDTHGLLVINHEYTNATLHPASRLGVVEGRRPLGEVRKEQAAHGLSIIEIRMDAGGRWQRVMPSAYNRRLTALTPMHISGPLAGHSLMKTCADPDGCEVLGTLNNCAMGVTPWGTYLMCEENWNIYFLNRDARDAASRPSHARYNIASRRQSPGKEYAWETVDARFDATPDAGQVHQGFVNEPHRFGWVVEVDPFDPASTPVKRTALGRCCREGATVVTGPDGRITVYSGDDTRGEYIYKFVTDVPVDPATTTLADHVLDRGTLFVARFDKDGSGRWLPLVWGANGLTPEAGFPDQGAVLVNARGAADVLGATPMDRPEWIAAHPATREMYVSLTNNDQRGNAQPIDAANPRPDNVHGQILRWREEDADPAATRFHWDLFLLAGETPGTATAATPAEHRGTIRGDAFSSPDGLVFDSAGRLWIATDYDDTAPHQQAMGCNQLLCADPVTREVRRFLVGPRGCEITGLAFAPDEKTLWINVQHPGISYPASDGKTRPRSTTVMITREGGGRVGT
jgi:secreted PhoX family phosphatase